MVVFFGLNTKRILIITSITMTTTTPSESRVRYVRQYNIDNRTSINASMKAYRDANKDEINRKNREKYARKKQERLALLPTVVPPTKEEINRKRRERYAMKKQQRLAQLAIV